MVGSVELHGRPHLRAIADVHFADIQNHAIEVEEHARAQTDVVPVIALKRRPDHPARTHLGQPLDQQCMRLREWLRAGGVVAHHPFRSRRLIGLQLCVGGVVEFACQHLLFFGLHAVLGAMQ